jgi:hypothetical protein
LIQEKGGEEGTRCSNRELRSLDIPSGSAAFIGGTRSRVSERGCGPSFGYWMNVSAEASAVKVQLQYCTINAQLSRIYDCFAAVASATARLPCLAGL